MKLIFLNYNYQFSYISVFISFEMKNLIYKANDILYKKRDFKN
ncbi:MAG: hypothetical protein BAJALOKI3v1_790009 [Promethearchaeota archaeon]|nr:MAG: hypothetical protein BAJALOKI3v1_790009 [Candidatus Lokiarchaeota archaeon]